MAKPVRPLSRAESFKTTASNHPQRRRRPVVEPNSTRTPPDGRRSHPGTPGERPAPHPGGVGLDDAQDVVQLSRAHAGAGAGAPRHRIGGGNIRIGAVVDVQVGALGAFKEDILALPDRLVNQDRDVGHQGLRRAPIS